VRKDYNFFHIGFADELSPVTLNKKQKDGITEIIAHVHSIFSMPGEVMANLRQAAKYAV
jgi:hypothetical protein